MNRLFLLFLATVGQAACASNAAYLPMSDPPEPVANVIASLYLIGDAGLANEGQQAVLGHVTHDLRAHVASHPRAPTLVVFLGDNIYDLGAREDFRDEDLGKLVPQVEAVIDAPAVRGVFVPGNHDWGKGARDPVGRTAIDVQRAWIDGVAGSREVGFLPSDGCPGPSVVHMTDDLYVFFIDTEWLLRRPEADPCGSVDDFYERLEAELAALDGKRIVLTAHHPMATGGPHGGNVSWHKNGPLVYYFAIKSGLSLQDLSSGRYSEMIQRIRASILASGVEPLAIATGHDHSLQVIRMTEPGSPQYQLVSGSAAKSSAAGRIDGTRYATSKHGYMRVDFTPSSARLVVFAWRADGSDDRVRPVFACTLTGSGEQEPCTEAPLARKGG